MVRFLRHYAPLISLAILTSLPLFLYGTSTVVDGPNHFYRLAELVWHIRHGDFYPRWFSDLHYGFGAPVFNFYAPLSYYIPVPFTLLGIELPPALIIGYVIAIFVAVLGMNQWVSEQFDSPHAGLVASAAYVFSPYFFYNILIRGAYPETWALAIAPWLFWSAHRLINAPTRHTQLIFTYFALCCVDPHTQSFCISLHARFVDLCCRISLANASIVPKNHPVISTWRRIRVRYCRFLFVTVHIRIAIHQFATRFT
jgi:uncharacterized membrane protein